MDAEQSKAMRTFYRDWAEGKVENERGGKLPVPSKFQDAYNNGYNGFFYDKEFTDNVYPKGTPQFYFWKYGWVRGFNELLCPHRVAG